jgi:hypothetical protein
MSDPQIVAQNAEADETFRKTLEISGATIVDDAVVLPTGAAFAWRIPTALRDAVDRRISGPPSAFNQAAELAMIAASVAGQCERIEHDDELSDVGRASAKQRVLEKEFPEAEKRVAWIANFCAGVEREDGAFYAADVIAPTDAASAMIDYEIRQRFDSLDEKSKVAFIEANGKNLRVLSALVRAPLPMTGANAQILTDRLAELFRKHKDASDPQRAERLRHWRLCAEFAKAVADQAAPTIPASATYKRRPGASRPTTATKRPTPVTRSQFEKLTPAAQHRHATAGGAVVDAA